MQHNDNDTVTANIPRFVIAGVHSGVGKTTIAISLMKALQQRGMRVAPFKVGPDYIDPGYHTAAISTPSKNLDSWMLTPNMMKYIFAESCKNMNVAVIEGVMGLYDGYAWQDDGSTAEIAKLLNAPVILILDTRHMSRSAAAIVYGYTHFDQKVKIAGVILNKIKSTRHREFVIKAIQEETQVPVLGSIPEGALSSIPERHLGLVTACESMYCDEFFTQLASNIEHHVDIDNLLATVTKQSPPLRHHLPEILKSTDIHPPVPTRIAVARDKAFCFYYHDNFSLMNRLGMEPVFFSPLSDSKLPDNIQGLYIGGGYPEVFAEALEKNTPMRNAIREYATANIPIYTECGGFMYLTNGIYDFNGKFYKMVGIFDTETRMLKKRKALGYVEVAIQAENIFGKQGNKIRGHEFHYSELARPPHNAKATYTICSRKGGPGKTEGYTTRNVLGSYVHLHFGSNLNFMKNFGQLCRKPIPPRLENT